MWLVLFFSFFLLPGPMISMAQDPAQSLQPDSAPEDAEDEDTETLSESEEGEDEDMEFEEDRGEDSEFEEDLDDADEIEEYDDQPSVPGQPVPSSHVSEKSQPEDKADQTKGQPKAEPTVSFFFDDADVFEVAQTVFGDILKVNYIIDPQVKGRVNFRTVTPIPKKDVLSVMEIILRLNGIGFVEEAGLYRILPLPNVSKELVYSQIGKPPEKVAIEMFTFENLELQEAIPDIENALGLHLKEGLVRIIPIMRLNALIVVASSMEQMDYIRKWVKVFDDMFSVARAKIFVYPLQNSKATHIAGLLQSIFSGTASTSTSAATPKPSAPPAAAGAAAAQRTGAAASVSGGGSFVSEETKVFADEITNSLIILATPADYAFIEETIQKLDTIPRQVVIECLIAEIRLTDDLEFGFAWSLQTDIKISGLKPFDNDIDLDGDMGQNASELASDFSSGFNFVATDPSGIVRARLEALAQDSRAEVLASPHVLVLDNREARIQIGDQVPIATSETAVSGTTDIQRTIQYKDTGVILKVTPQINEGGLVTLELSQEVSTYSLQTIFGSDQVVISKREAVTNMIAQDGQTVVIGGLIQELKNKTREGIPFLKDIPLLGYFFGSSRDQFERRELVILLTPHVLRNLQDTNTISSGYIQRIQGAEDERKELIRDEFILDKNELQKSSEANK
jgi:type II secretory pathway component GspD/PulD (secretin)